MLHEPVRQQLVRPGLRGAAGALARIGAEQRGDGPGGGRHVRPWWAFLMPGVPDRLLPDRCGARRAWPFPSCLPGTRGGARCVEQRAVVVEQVRLGVLEQEVAERLGRR
jgi:hypothetical protein